MKKAVCVLTNNEPGIQGFIEFNELNNNLLEIKVNISGLQEGFHGFHIHQTGDLRKGCSGFFGRDQPGIAFNITLRVLSSFVFVKCSYATFTSNVGTVAFGGLNNSFANAFLSAINFFC